MQRTFDAITASGRAFEASARTSAALSAATEISRRRSEEPDRPDTTLDDALLGVAVAGALESLTDTGSSSDSGSFDSFSSPDTGGDFSGGGGDFGGGGSSSDW